MDTAKLFTSLTLISLLSSPLIHSFQALPSLAASLSCLERCQAYFHKISNLQMPASPSKRRSRSASFHHISDEKGIHAITRKPETYSRETDSKPSHKIHLMGDFKWASSSHVVLHEIDLQIDPANFVIILGPVGSGKSTLLNILLGNVTCIRGMASIRANKIAFCSQTPWLINATFRDNIIGPSAYDHAFFRTILYVCYLTSDLESLPDGDNTNIGSEGIRLSGGQRQRLVSYKYSLCFAKYSESIQCI